MIEAIDPLRCELTGWNLIEAAAGTGKTHTLTTLYLRLIAEQGLLPKQILAVTFTRAATAELKQRIGERLMDLLRTLQGDADDEKPLAEALLASVGDSERLFGRLRQALMDLDQAAVFTIDGFCRRLLSERPMATGLPMQIDLQADEQRYLTELIAPRWQADLAALDERLSRWLLDRNASPAWLAGRLKPYVWQPDIALQPVVPSPLPSTVDLRALWARVAAVWVQRHDALCAWLGDPSTPTQKNSYSKGNLPNWRQQIDTWLSGPTPDFMAGAHDKLWRFTRPGIREKSKADIAQWAEPELLDLLDELAQTFTDLAQALAEAAIAWEQGWLATLRELSREARRGSGQLSYGELKFEVAEALQGPRGDELAAQARDAFRVALIDEFQDTDPLQYRIFRDLFQGAGSICFLVGDPKQSIYRFRGADIYAYLNAREEARVYALNENWRSTPEMIEAVNGLFSSRDAPFVEARIGFDPARPADKDRQASRYPIAMQWLLWRGDGDKQPNKETATTELAEQTAEAIAGLLDDGSLRPGDIAVLTRSHGEASACAQSLYARRIPYVRTEQDSVFNTDEADQLGFLLAAMVHSHRIGAVRTALASRLIGLSAEALLGLSDATEAEHMQRLREAHERWLLRGVGAAVAGLFEIYGTVARMRSAAHGERALTNLLHLLDLLQSAERDQAEGPAALLNWLRLRQHEAGEENRETTDDHLLRLESEADRVQLMTIHKSKGLQFPVVFAPFVGVGGKGPKRPGQPTTLHEGGQQVLWPEQIDATALQAVQREVRAEDMRLLYVATTRAKELCILGAADITGFANSMLGHLFDDFAALHDGPAGLARIGDLLTSNPVTERAPGTGQEQGSWRPLHRRIQRPGGSTSFTALAHQADASGRDVDQFDGAPATQQTALAHDRHGLPRGALTGQAIHRYLEHWQQDSSASAAGAALRAYGLAEPWADVVADIGHHVLHTPVHEGLRLIDIPQARQRAEMAFTLRLAALDAEDLHNLLARHGYADVCGTFAPLQPGYLRGFIDLVFEHDGRFFLADYKSNWLGADDTSYRPERLPAAIASGRYALQYLLYTVAVHRWLQQRLSGYDYARDFGGVFYLFVRGMRVDGPAGQGVFFDRPGPALIEALDALLDREPVSP